MMKQRLLVLAVSLLFLGTGLIQAEPVPHKLFVPFGGIQLAQPDAFAGTVLRVVPGGTGSKDALSDAADRIIETQCNAACDGKGWGWPLDCPASPEDVPGNILGPTGTGLISGYNYTGDLAHITGAMEAGDYAKCYSYSTGEPRFGTGTPYFLWYITSVLPAATSYRDYADTEYFQALEDGTYGDHPYDTAGYLQYMWDARTGAGYGNIIPYDLSTVLFASYLMGTEDQFSQFANLMYDAIDNLDTTSSFNMAGLSCAILGLQFSHIDFDPQAGAWASDDSAWDLAETLVQYQHSSGGFLYDIVSLTPNTAVAWQIDTDHWYSGTGNNANATLTKMVTLTSTTQLTFDMYYNIESDWDFGYVEYSSDGSNWTTMAGTYTDAGHDNGISGCQTTWVTETMNFPALGTYFLRFRYRTDGATEGNSGCGAKDINPGWYIDNINIDGTLDTCDTANGWTSDSQTFTMDDMEWYDLGLQVTAYSLMALKCVDPWYYATEISAAEDWLYDQQMPNGGFDMYYDYWGASYYENSQVNGEVIWAIDFQPDPWNDGDVNNDHIHTPADAQMAFQYYLQIITDLNFQDYNSADCNADGQVSPGDGLCIWKHYLGVGCSCADPIITPPARTSKKASLELTAVKPDGLLTESVKTAGDSVTVQIRIDRTEHLVDAFGLRVAYPAGWQYQGADFGDAVQKFDYYGANVLGSEIVVGGFALRDSMQTGDLVTLKFKMTDTLAQPGFRISNLVDDIGNFSVSMN